jgi:hypothetical protein
MFDKSIDFLEFCDFLVCVCVLPSSNLMLHIWDLFSVYFCGDFDAILWSFWFNNCDDG